MLKLGIELSQASVGRYIVRRHGPLSAEASEAACGLLSLGRH